MGKLNKTKKIRLNMELLSKSSWTMQREQYDKTKTLGSLEKKTKEKQRNMRKTEKKQTQRRKGWSVHMLKPVEHTQLCF